MLIGGQIVKMYYIPFLKKKYTTYIQEVHYLKVVKKDLKIPALQNL